MSKGNQAIIHEGIQSKMKLWGPLVINMFLNGLFNNIHNFRAGYLYVTILF